MGENRSRISVMYHEQEEMGMDRSHPAKAKRKHHQTGSGTEPIGKTKSWKTKTFMEKRDGGRDGGRGPQPEKLEKVAQNRVGWKLIVDGLCSTSG